MSIDDLFNLIKSSFKEVKSDSEVKFDALSSSVKEIKNNLNEQNNKVDTLNELSSNVNDQKMKCESSFNELSKRLSLIHI